MPCAAEPIGASHAAHKATTTMLLRWMDGMQSKVKLWLKAPHKPSEDTHCCDCKSALGCVQCRRSSHSAEVQD